MPSVAPDEIMLQPGLGDLFRGLREPAWPFCRIWAVVAHGWEEVPKKISSIPKYLALVIVASRLASVGDAHSQDRARFGLGFGSCSASPSAVATAGSAVVLQTVNAILSCCFANIIRLPDDHHERGCRPGPDFTADAADQPDPPKNGTENDTARAGGGGGGE